MGSEDGRESRSRFACCCWLHERCDAVASMIYATVIDLHVFMAPAGCWPCLLVSCLRPPRFNFRREIGDELRNFFACMRACIEREAHVTKHGRSKHCCVHWQPSPLCMRDARPACSSRPPPSPTSGCEVVFEFLEILYSSCTDRGVERNSRRLSELSTRDWANLDTSRITDFCNMN